MKRLFLLIAMLVLGGLMAWAQTNAQSSTSSSGTSATSNQTSTDQTSNSNSATPAATPQDNTGTAATQDNAGTAATQNNTGTAATGTHAHKSHKNGRLPQTASPLPFLGMIGFGSMAAGMVMRKIRK